MLTFFVYYYGGLDNEEISELMVHSLNQQNITSWIFGEYLYNIVVQSQVDWVKFILEEI